VEIVLVLAVLLWWALPWVVGYRLNKERERKYWWVYVLLGGWIGVLILAFLPDPPPSFERLDTVECGTCGYRAPSKNTICPRCRTDLGVQTSECQSCGFSAPPHAVRCPKCRADLVPVEGAVL
jgi:hypothetical protein